MAEGYERQAPSYEKMLELAKKQHEVLEKEEVDVEQLLKLIDQRQELIVLLGKMNEGLASLKEEIKDSLGIEEFNLSNIKKELSGQGVDALSAVLQKLGSILATIKKLDQENENALRQIMQKTQEQLKRLQNLKKADQAYQSEPLVDGGIFIDYSK